MDFDETYNVTSSLTQNGGRKLTLKYLDQSQTYSGMLEGTPNRKFNDWEIENDLKYAAKYRFAMGSPYLIEPKRRDYFRQPGDMNHIRERTSQYPAEWGRDPEWLPLIRCIGCLFSSSTSKNPMKDVSTLTVLWYQNDFAYPIENDILTALRSMDWDRLAADFEY
ncbi:MAG: hypothetical protein ACK5YR_18405 [Pirellula sp.]